MRWLSLLAVAALGACAAEDLPPVSSASTSQGTSSSASESTSGTSAGATGETTQTGDSSDTGDTGDTGHSEQCTECYGPFCESEAGACTADEVCNCLLNCEGDNCETECGSSQVFVDLFVCIADASSGPCEFACGSACESCIYLDCQPEFADCFAEASCVCALPCGTDQACIDACGEPLTFDPLRTCIEQAGLGECADACAG